MTYTLRIITFWDAFVTIALVRPAATIISCGRLFCLGRSFHLTKGREIVVILLKSGYIEDER